MADDTRETLEQAVREAPADPVPRLVLGDWLQQHGDPAGALVTLQHGSDPRSADRYLRAHHAELLGALPPAKLDWFCGFVRSVTLGEGLSIEQKTRAVRMLPALTVGRFVEEVTLAFDPYENPTSVLEALAFASLRQLTVKGGAACVLDGAWDPMGRLESLTLARVASLGTVRAPKLRAVAMAVDAPGPLVALSGVPIGRLALQLGGSVALPHVQPLLARVTDLSVAGCRFSDALCAEIAKVRGLTSLALTGGDLTLSGARALAAGKLRLAALDVTGNHLEPAAKPVLMRLCAGVKFGEQQVDAEVVHEARPEGWLVLDRPTVDLDLAVRSGAMLGKHHTLRDLVLETRGAVSFGGEPRATTLRVLGLGGAMRLDEFAESLARRTESLRRADKFRVLCLHLSPTTAAYRLFDATGEIGHAAGADAEVLAEGLAALLGTPAPPDFLDRLRTRGEARAVIDDHAPVPAGAPAPNVTQLIPFARMDIAFDVEARPRGEDDGVGPCTGCGAEAELSPCDDCGEAFCAECLQQPERSTAYVCRDCDETPARYEGVGE